MIANAILWVDNPERLLQRAGGISVLERQLHTAARAGLRRLWISCDPPRGPTARLSLPPGLELAWNPRAAQGAHAAAAPLAAAAACHPPYLVLSGAHFIRV
ncbi:MAG: hypothetical protein PHF00_03625, partial [Elusimicrobia bacterium]|nr:hypothetical protein [Elusimicrobiota bacterium]